MVEEVLEGKSKRGEVQRCAGSMFGGISVGFSERNLLN